MSHNIILLYGRYNNVEENIIDVGKKMMRGDKICV